MKKILFFILVPLVISCDNEAIDIRGKTETEINIYLEKAGGIENYTSDTGIETILLESKPWLKNSEIELYDWSSHMFYLNTAKEKEKYAGRKFVVEQEPSHHEVQNKRLFIGVFFPVYMSSVPQIPFISAYDGFTPADVVSFSQFGLYPHENMDDQLEFKEALINAGYFHKGIDVEMLRIDRKSSSTLSYTFRITNNDDEYLYILDPNKMGEGRFHYFTNGISLWKNSTSYFSQDQSISVPEVKSSWYTKLAPQKSMERTITLSGFTDLPTGSVQYSFSFPGSQVSTGEWKKSDGRIWLGSKFIQGEINLR